MKTKHKIVCENCTTENPLYKVTCNECGHFLRGAVVNLDLWQTIWALFEKPTATIKKIIFAEHKNFIPFLLVLFSIKIYSLFIILNFAFIKNINITFNKGNILWGIVVCFVIILVIIKIITVVFNTPQKRTRYKDNLALTAYSFIPTILTFIILTPIEFGIFGIHWFIYNPSPILINESTAYILYIIETIMFVWSLFVLFKSYFIQSNSIIKTFIAILLLFVTLFTTLNFTSLISP